MRKIVLIVSYDGTGFSGWQVQPDAPSVQQTLETAVCNVTGERVRVEGAGRTDAGVHAAYQVAAFTTSNDRIPAEKFREALNARLPAAVRVFKSGEIDLDFSPRRRAVEREYRYSVVTGSVRSPLLPPYVFFAGKTVLEPEKLDKIASLFVGEHDFTAFCSVRDVNKSKIRTIISSYWSERDGISVYTVRGVSFLMNMVRRMVGSMLQYMNDENGEAMIREALLSGDCRLSGPTVSPQGLRLTGVFYPESYAFFRERA